MELGKLWRTIQKTVILLHFKTQNYRKRLTILRMTCGPGDGQFTGAGFNITQLPIKRFFGITTNMAQG